MKTLLLNVPSFSGKIVSPTWIKAVRDFQSNRRQKEIRIVRLVDVREGVTCAMI